MEGSGLWYFFAGLMFTLVVLAIVEKRAEKADE
jgi:hypothetical protein